MTPIIDMHAHVFTDELAVRAIPQLAERSDLVPTYDGTVAGLLAEMDCAGIDSAVTQPVATKPSQVMTINSWAASTASERIIPFGAMHPDFENPAAEIERMALLGMRGFKMHTEYQAFDPDEARLTPIYEAATKYGLIVLFHAGLDAGVPTDHGRPPRFARMLENHPDLTVVLAHMGGWQLWDEVREHIAGRPVYLDTSFARGYMTDDEFLDLVSRHGSERILFGTDGPWGNMVAEVAWMRSLPLSEADREAIFGKNAAALLGL